MCEGINALPFGFIFIFIGGVTVRMGGVDR